MIEQDQMYQSFLLKYSTKHLKSKKQPSYILQKKQAIPDLPLHQAISQKKNVNLMQDSYNPQHVEKYWDTWWNQNQFFKADVNSKNPNKFVICLPPPNVTGYLHIGHALTISVQDSLSRRKRMQNFQTLYIPGTDHAGIATQSVVQKQLMRQQKKTRYDLGREQFLKKVWNWKQNYGHAILNQLRRVGASVDWSRQFFTMDSNLSLAVNQAFTQLFEQGLIYRANRLVNWSCALKTAISDIEVEFQDIDKSTMISVPGYEKKVQFGVLNYFAYKLKQGSQIIIATTRLQTMLGDVAVAVNPNDNRYKQFIGKQLIHPFLPNRKMKVIGDTFVEIEFGTGAAKITPAHDADDYACAHRHGLQFINILTQDGKINQNGGKFSGMKRYDCRKLIQQQLKKLNLWKQKKNNKMRLGFCQRSGDIIQPMIKPQWYVSCSDISKPMIQLVKNKSMKIIPSSEQQTWYRWIGGLRDWCISRQLWWGHRIPAYLAYKKGSTRPESLDSANWIAAKNIQQAYLKASQKLSLPKQQIQLQQDNDVLDTWFSSGILPFSALKWPNTSSPDYTQFFPTQILQTGHDILFFWVARMVMMSLWLTSKIPFKQVLLHPLVCDSQGKKMSKSLGNVIDPLQIIQGCNIDVLINKIRNSNLSKDQQDKSVKKIKQQFPQGISQCGSDALRFGLLSYMSQSKSINLNIKKIQSYRKFCNKIWNSYKYSIPKLQFITQLNPTLINPTTQNFLNSWILARLNFAIESINNNFEQYNLGQVTNIFFNFWLYQFCDVYLEATKPLFINGSAQDKQHTALTLFICLQTGLRLLHPMMPFISEQLYQKLPEYPGKSPSITKSPYPQPLTSHHATAAHHFAQIQTQFQLVNKFAATLRSIASGVNLPPHIKPDAFIITQQSIIRQQTDLLATLGKCNKINIIDSQQQIPKGCGVASIGPNKIYLQLLKYIDTNKQILRLTKKLQQITKFKQNLDKKIKDPLRNKKPEKVIQEQDQQMNKFIIQQNTLLDGLDKIKKLV